MNGNDILVFEEQIREQDKFIEKFIELNRVKAIKSWEEFVIDEYADWLERDPYYADDSKQIGD